MIGSISLSWKGADETFRSLDSLQEAIQKARHDSLVTYGEDAVEGMKKRHDADAHEVMRYVNRTWYLTNSITFDTQLMSEKTERLRVFTPAFYAGMVEYGTARSKAYPFFWIEIYGLEPAAVARHSPQFPQGAVGPSAHLCRHLRPVHDRDPAAYRAGRGMRAFPVA